MENMFVIYGILTTSKACLVCFPTNQSIVILELKLVFGGSRIKQNNQVNIIKIVGGIGSYPRKEHARENMNSHKK